MRLSPDISGLVASLRDAGTDPAIPRRRARVAEEIAQRLERPARVTLLGLPDGDPGAIANALAGTEVIRPDWPTTEFRRGPEPGFDVTLTNRRVVSGRGVPSLDDLPAAPAFIRLTGGMPAIPGVSILMVRARADAGDQRAAMRWAAGRTDIAIWCGAALDPTELALWQAAPDPLPHHAFLISRQDKVPSSVAQLFQACISTMSGTWIPDLTAALTGHIAEARSEDAAAAELFLSKLDRRASRPTQVPAQNPLPDPLTDTTEKPERLPNPVSWALLSRMSLRLRHDARALLLTLSDPTRGDGADTEVLQSIEDLLTDLQCTLDGSDLSSGELSGLSAMIDEAAELALLLRYEGGAPQAAQAAALLLQVRQDIETELEQAA